MAFLSGYTTRKKITIDKDKIDSNLTDFPVLVKLTSSNFDFSKANSDGYDIRFTSADGTTLLKYERERHDSTNKLAEYWVKIPSVSSSAPTIFYLYYKTEDTADGADPTNVWDTNFNGVYHLNETSGTTLSSSTVSPENLTKLSATEPNPVTGKIVGGQDFDGVNDYASKSASTFLSGLNTLTFSFWIRFDSLAAGEQGIIARSAVTGQYAFYVTWSVADFANRFHIGVYNGTSWGYYNGTVELSLLVGTWYKIDVTYDAGYVRFYKDGAQYDAGQTGGNISVNTNSGTYYFGKTWNPKYINGVLDEIEISSTVRSSAWIKASYNSGNNSLVSYGGEEGIDNVLFFGCNF